jgi:Flp pilus assembly pilin Flp
MAIELASLIGRTLRRKRRGFARDDRGVTAVEFGLLALPFFAIVGAILETAIVFLSGQILDSAVHDVSRLIRTGQAQTAGMSAENFKQSVCGRLFGLFSDCSGLHLEVEVLDKFNAASITPPVDWNCQEDACDQWTRPEAYIPGQGSSIVLVQVYYKWPTILNLGGMGMANLYGNKRLLGAATAGS